MLARALVLGLVALPLACGRDVVLGIDPVDAGAQGADGGDASAGGSGGARTVVALPDAWLLGGFTRAATGDEASSDLWAGKLTGSGALTPVLSLDDSGAADRVNAAIVHPDGGYVLAGFVTKGLQRHAWVRRVGADGSATWTTTLSDTGDMVVEGIAVDQGDVILSGIEGAPPDGWVARLDPAGVLRWRTDIRSAVGATGTRTHAVAVGPNHALLAAGDRTVSSGGASVTVPTVLQLAPDGAGVWNSSVSLFDAPGSARSIFLLSSSTVVVCADTDAGPAIAITDPLFGSSQHSTFAVAAELIGCVPATDGGILLAGTLEAAPAPWVGKHDLAPFTQRWSRTPSVSRPTHVAAIGAGPGGTGLLVGRAENPAEPFWLDVAP